MIKQKEKEYPTITDTIRNFDPENDGAKNYINGLGGFS